MMTFSQFVWLDTLLRRGGSARFWELDDECRIGGSSWPHFKRLRETGMVFCAGHWNPYVITERGRIAHALQSIIYARRARQRGRAA